MRINKRKNNRYKKVSLVISTTIIGLGISTNLLPMSTSNHIRAEANGGFLNCIWSYFSPSNHYPSKTHIDTEMLNVDWLKQIFDPVVREAIVNSYNRQCTVDGGTYIRSAYQLSNHDLLKITQLVYSGSGDEHVVSLGGVDKYLPNLQSIDLQNVDMHKVDLTPIAKLPKLGCLNLSNDKITDVTKLSHSRCLEWLYLNNNRITDLSNLKLNSLTSFEVNNNQIKDIANIQFPTIVWTKFNNQNIIENKEVIINKELKQQIIDIPISLFTANRDNNGFYYPLPVGHNVMIGNGPHDFFLNENKEVIMGNYHSNIFVPYDVGHKSYSVDKNGSYVVNNGFRGFTYILTPDRERPAFLKFYYKDRSGKVSGVYNINFSWTEKNISDENAVFDSRKITNLDSRKTAGSMTNTAPISENQVSSQAGNHDSVATPAKPSVTTSDKTAGSMTNTAPISENQVSSQAGNHDSVATPAKPSVTTSDKTAGSMTNTAPISENQVSSQAGNHDSVATPAKPSVTTSDKTAGSMTNTAPISENQVSSQAGNHDSVATPAMPTMENTTHQVVTTSSTVPSSIAKPMAVKPESSNGISSTGVSVNRQTNGLITSNQVAPTKVKLNIYLNVHKKYTKNPLKKMKIEKIRNLKGQIVYIKKALNIYSKNNFAIKYRLHEFKKIGLKYGPKFLVLGLTHSSKHSPRYKVVLINVRTGRPQHGYKYTYGYITGKKSYVEPLYHNSKVKKARILSNKITEYKDIHFTKKVRNIKHGRLLKIKAVKRLVRKHRVTFLLQLSNHHYITANKKWVAKVK